MLQNLSQGTRQRLLLLMRVLEEHPALTSREAEELTGNSSQSIRKDISALGERVGSAQGYQAATLLPAIREALGLGRPIGACIVGLGRLGSAYLHVEKKELGEFELRAGFDSNVNRVEILQSPIPLYPAFKIPEVLERFSIEVALLCVPAEAAQGAAEKLVQGGIRGIVNYAPRALNLPPGIGVRNVHPVDELRALASMLH